MQRRKYLRRLTTIENASYGACNCAERTALFRAVYEEKKEFCAIAIVGKSQEKEEFDYCAPCGICRQVMYDSFIVVMKHSMPIRKK